MNFRLSLVFVVIAVVLGGYLLLGPGLTQPEPSDSPTSQEWFYLVDDSTINRLDVTYFGDASVFVRDSERQWHLDDENGQLVSEEFRGTPFLAGGARTPRLIAENADAEAAALYGLDDPKISLRFYLENGQDYTVLIGGLTPDRITNYAQIQGTPEIYLLDRTWGEHMARLITEPSIFLSTPAPTPSADS